MPNNKTNLCYIWTVLHLLLLNLLPLAPNLFVYSVMYILSYAFPIIFLLISFPVKNIKVMSINASDILIFFPSMIVTSFLLTLFLGSPSTSYKLTPSVFIMTGIIVPVCEELFWRGSVFRVLKRFGFVPAALISSFFFALMHKGTSGIIYAMFSGIIFSYLTYSTESTLSSIILHIINNSAALLISTNNSLIMIIVPVCIIIGILLKVLMPKHKHTGSYKSQRGAFKMPYLYITTIIFIAFRIMEAKLG